MIIEHIEWDDVNLSHATRHGLSVTEIVQAVNNAESMRRNKRGRSGDVRIDSVTGGGRKVVVIAIYNSARRSLRPITAWEA